MFFTVTIIFFATLALSHLLINKPYKPSTISWILFIIGFPQLGPLVYLLFGINRITRKISVQRKGSYLKQSDRSSKPILTEEICFTSLSAYSERVTGSALLPGNKVEILIGGEEAYPRMLEGIKKADKEILLSSYIFANDSTGSLFTKELASAVRRGVDVKVLLDAVGSRYSVPSALNGLAEARVETQVFMPTRFPWHLRYLQLRNHRKLLLIDGNKGFIGGMNIQSENTPQSSSPISDLCFLVSGPVLPQLRDVFIGDWKFSGGNIVSAQLLPGPAPTGDTSLRAISDGPDSDFGKLRWILIGAINAAEEKIQIVTPYFLPDISIQTALIAAVFRGVRVEVILPKSSNLLLVQWAMQPLLQILIKQGIKIFLTDPPFDHSKLMLVDDKWALIGSANWDARSLVFNFEINLECYSKELVKELSQLVDKKKSMANQVSSKELEQITILHKSRNSLAALLSPYL